MEPQVLQDSLRHAENNGVYHLPTSGRDVLRQAASDAELSFHLVNLDDCEDLDSAFELIGEGMAFPEWFGRNFDALYDCLTDLSWQDTSSTVILLTGCDALHAALPEEWETLIGVFRAALEFWRDEEVPFWVFIDMRADGLAVLPTIA